MKTLPFKMIALAIGLASSVGVGAEQMSSNEHKLAANKIDVEYKAAKEGCDAYRGNRKDICVAEAKGGVKIARADLEANYKPSLKAQYKAHVAKAEADYSIARERCDDLAGNAKDVCVKQARAAETIAIADAKAQLQSASAGAKAIEKTAEARSEANSTKASARETATEDKLEARYAVAKEKCNAFDGDIKDRCLNQAKESFGKS